MGTPLKPIRLFLSPKFITPLSPSLKAKQFKQCRNGNIVRKLDFSTSPAAKLHKEHIESTIKINILDTDYLNVNNSSNNNNNCLLVNTPNKLNILKYGFTSFKGLNILGRGAFGTVVRGRYKGEDVAVKVVKTKSALNESNALKLNHVNVIKIKEIIRNDINSIIIMEYLEKTKHLQTVLDDERMDLNFKKILKISKDICNGLKYCHENKLLHLDMKPSNVLVCRDGTCKICDFGNSTVCGNDFKNYKHEGTVIYTAPEILLGKCPTFASDIYSLGIIFWQLRYREMPFVQLENNDVIIYKVVKFGQRPSSKSNEILDNYSNLYKSCWNTIPCMRPSMHTVINTLSDI